MRMSFKGMSYKGGVSNHKDKVDDVLKLNNRARKKLADARRVIVSKYYLEGLSHSEIAEKVKTELGVPTCSIATVNTDIKKIREEWKGERITNYDELVAVQVKRHMQTRREALEGYKRSITEEQQRDRRIVTPDGSEETPTSRIEQTRDKKEFGGDPRFLEIVHKVDCEMNKLLGAYPAEKKEISGDVSFGQFLMESGIITDEEEVE